MAELGIWRGASVAKHYVTLTPANFRSAWVTAEISTSEPAGDKATWEGNPGTSLTLRFRHTQGGTPVGDAPNFANVSIRLPGSGTNIGSTWAVAFPAVNTDVTRTFHFDDDPLNQIAGAIRSGMLEIYLSWGNTGGVVTWSADSRGGGTPAALNSIDNARGYLRSLCILSNDPAPSNVSIGGAQPSLFATPDPIHTRLSLSAVKYRSVGLELEMVRTGTSTVERQQTVTQTAVDHDYSWTGTTGDNRRVGNGIFLGSEAKDLLAKMAALDFGGDNEYSFAATGHAAGWSVDNALQLRNASEMTVDPRLCVRNDANINGSAPGALYHTQLVGNTFLDPPSFGDIVSGQRVFPDVGFLSVRYSNARGEGQDGLSVTLKIWDADNLTGTESVPTHTFSGTTRLSPDPPPTPASPQSGWLPAAASGADENKLPLTWSTVAAGVWRIKSVLTAPSDLTALEAYPFVSGGNSWNRNVFFVTTSPNVAAVISIHPENVAHHGTHLTTEDSLIPVCYLVDHAENKLIELDPANGDEVHIFIVREHHPTMRMDYFDFVNEVWVEKTNAGTFPPEAQLLLVSGSVHTGGGDPDIWTTATHIGGDIFLPDPGGELDCMIVADFIYSGVHYTGFAPVVFVGEANKHNVFLSLN